jgi:hypothetical protein
MRSATAFLAAIAFVAACPAVYALSTGGPGGTWPKGWPKELEPLRKQAWTWEHDFSGKSYDIPFANREEFEAAWPHLLKLKSKGVPITLLRGPQLRVGSGKTAGVRIDPPVKSVTEGPLSVTRIVLVVDGDIVDLNRIPLPADTPIIDERFKDGDKKDGDKNAPAPGGGNPEVEPRPAASIKKDAAEPKP